MEFPSTPPFRWRAIPVPRICPHQFHPPNSLNPPLHDFGISLYPSTPNLLPPCRIPPHDRSPLPSPNAPPFFLSSPISLPCTSRVHEFGNSRIHNVTKSDHEFTNSRTPRDHEVTNPYIVKPPSIPCPTELLPPHHGTQTAGPPNSTHHTS